ncbi:alpha/beta hydrolase fold domain-containing protein [Carboxylicivirga taeanensis]|uniref:alpha/beta hydrolase fold domain-containing protein n=1 Tax=Carboxylicivirga taeanensis TaxID=1416875 RepID=UPI003F6DB796
MKYIVLFWVMLILSPVYSADPPISDGLSIWLKNGSGITEQDGGVVLWQNQIGNNCHAEQNNLNLTGQLMYETYPGKVNVGFTANNSCLHLINSNQFFSNQSYTVFYVGKVGDVKNIASLLCNFRPSADWSSYTGFRFACNAKEELVLQYGNPKWTQVILSQMSPNSFFYFGFTINEAGDYLYFDSQSDEVSSGSIIGTIEPGALDLNFNLHLTPSGSQTYDHTEVAELLTYNRTLPPAQFAEIRNWLAEEYSDLSNSAFEVSEFTPVASTELSSSGSISLTFSKELKQPIINYPDVYINKVLANDICLWTTTSSTTLNLKPNSSWTKGDLVSVVVNPLLESADGSLYEGVRAEYEFIVETENDFGIEHVEIPTIATRNDGTHNIPLKLVLPLRRNGKVPVHFWVHGGGWNGGTLSNSYASNSPHAEYLAANLGIANIGIAYRCKGSNGDFTQAMEDIDAAYQWVVENADTYNLDIGNSFFSGGSAGTPLASLVAQRYSSTKAFVGFNGIYNFVDNYGPWGTGNDYGQQEPSATQNSAYYNLRTNPPATILIHGDADATISHQQSILFAQKINDSGGDATSIIYADEPHAFFNPGWEQYEDVLFEMVTFLKRNGIYQTEDIAADINIGVNEFEKPYVLASDISTTSWTIKPINTEIKVRIYNTSGLIVYENLKVCSLTPINMSSQPAGVYIISLENGEYTFTEKILNL